MSRFNLTDVQSQAILDMQLRRLAALERQKIEDEHRDVLAMITHLENLLNSPLKILDVIKADLEEITKKFGDKRRTTIAYDASEDLNDEDLIADEQVLVSITERGDTLFAPT